MTTQPTIFDKTYDWRQHQWTKEWYAVYNRASGLSTIADALEILFNKPTSQSEAVEMHNNAISYAEKEPDWPNLLLHQDLQRDQEPLERLFTHFRDTNFDQMQTQHIQRFFKHAQSLAIAYRKLFSVGQLELLEDDPATPLIHVSAELQRRCSVDLRIAESALMQRLRVRIEDSEDTQLTWQGHLLYLADLMAYKAIQPLKGAGIIPSGAAVITYMQQNTAIRLLPYYDVLFIGIPSSISREYAVLPILYLAIPHEIGHYLFRYGTIDGQFAYQKLEQALDDQNINDWRRHWLEELFADAYGCLVAGPISVLSIQEYIADNLPARLLENSPKHPIAALRPLIQSEMLRELDRRSEKKLNYKKAPDLLDDHWQLYLNGYGGKQLSGEPLDASFELLGQQQPMTGRDVIQALQVVIQEIFDVIDELLPDVDWQAWSHDIEERKPQIRDNLHIFNRSLASFYGEGKTFHHSDIKPPPLTTSDQLSDLHQRVSEIADQIVNSQTSIPVTVWRKIYAVVGWSDEGPETDEH
ncbi:hypothetical protein KFU94_20910 [Chloroflexi bacterium TSY]|nr:hypothetical protein [Chloroflexi bacterium TSY]